MTPFHVQETSSSGLGVKTSACCAATATQVSSTSCQGAVGEVKGEGIQLLRWPSSAHFLFQDRREPREASSRKDNISAYSWKAWEMLVDPGKQLVFPPEIKQITLRSDTVMWSTAAKKVIIIKLTFPWEAGIPPAHEFKRLKFSETGSRVQWRWAGVRPSTQSKLDAGALWSNQQS